MTNSFLFTFLFEIGLPMLIMFVLGLGALLLGRWLRHLGYGKRLDALDVKFHKIQQKKNKIMKPLAFGMLRMGRGLHSMPFLGSKQQRQKWEYMEAQLRVNLDSDAKCQK